MVFMYILLGYLCTFTYTLTSTIDLASLPTCQHASRPALQIASHTRKSFMGWDESEPDCYILTILTILTILAYHMAISDLFKQKQMLKQIHKQIIKTIQQQIYLGFWASKTSLGHQKKNASKVRAS